MDIEQAMDKYLEQFGKPYPLAFGSGMTAEEVITDIQNCINTGKEATPPEYQDDCDY